MSGPHLRLGFSSERRVVHLHCTRLNESQVGRNLVSSFHLHQVSHCELGDVQGDPMTLPYHHTVERNHLLEPFHHTRGGSLLEISKSSSDEDDHQKRDCGDKLNRKKKVNFFSRKMNKGCSDVVRNGVVHRVRDEAEKSCNPEDDVERREEVSKENGPFGSLLGRSEHVGTVRHHSLGCLFLRKSLLNVTPILLAQFFFIDYVLVLQFHFQQKG